MSSFFPTCLVVFIIMKNFEMRKVGSLLRTQQHNSSNEIERREIIAVVPNTPDTSIGVELNSIIAGGNNVEQSPLSLCSPTSQINVVSIMATRDESDEPPQQQESNNTSFSNINNTTSIWILETIDEHGARKDVGGDEFVVNYNYYHPGDKSKIAYTARAMTTDNHDGTYMLEFVTHYFGFGGKSDKFDERMISPTGELSITLVYTCSIGRMTRPSKDTWSSGGYLGKEYTVSNMTHPPTRRYQPPNSDKSRIDLAKYDQVLCFGDSLLQNFCGFHYDHAVHFRHEKPHNMIPVINHGSEIRSDLLVNITLPTIEEVHGKTLRQENISVALILASGAWDVSSNQGPIHGKYFNDTLQMNRDLVLKVRERYPRATLFWKSVSAVHMSVLDKNNCKRGCNDRVRYIANSVMEYLYNEQKTIMKELNVNFLDLWETTYIGENWHMEGDAQHYRVWMNEFQLQLFHSEMKMGG